MMPQNTGRPRRRFLITLLLLLCLPALLLFPSGLLGDRSSRESQTLLEEGLRRAAVQCYALEGAYPPNLEHLTGRYGVVVDRSRFFVDYQYVAANLMPDITVLPAGN